MVMTRTPDEIKKGLECCMDYQNCTEGEDPQCPYYDAQRCMEALLADALALIQQLEKDNDQLRNYIRLLQAERDAAVDGLKKAANEKGECFECKWYNGKNCTHQDYKTICCSHDDKWEWRGVQKEE